MKILTLAALLLVSLLPARSQQLAPFSIPDITPSTTEFVNDTLYPATVLLYHQTDDGSMNFVCTATAVHQDPSHVGVYFLATAAHCVEGTLYVTLDERGYAKVFTRVLDKKCDTKADVCLLLIKSPVKMKTVELGDDPTMGESIISVESPVGLGKMILHGSVAMPYLDRPLSTGKGSWQGDTVLQLPGVLQGSSGSAIVSEENHTICAIAVGVYAGRVGQLQIAVPVSKLKFLLLKLALAK